MLILREIRLETRTRTYKTGSQQWTAVSLSLGLVSNAKRRYVMPAKEPMHISCNITRSLYQVHHEWLAARNHIVFMIVCGYLQLATHLWIGFLTVFDAILTGRQNDQKLQCLYGNPMANNSFPKVNFSQFVNQNIKVLSIRLYSPSLKDVAWLEDAQLISLIFHTFVCIFFPTNRV